MLQGVCQGYWFQEVGLIVNNMSVALLSKNKRFLKLSICHIYKSSYTSLFLIEIHQFQYYNYELPHLVRTFSSMLILYLLTILRYFGTF